MKATRAKPEERFQTATEMAEQLVGVLRTVVGETADLGPAESSIFAPDSDRGSDPGKGPDSGGVPKLRVDPEDAAASVIMAAGAVPDPERRYAMFKRALKQYPDSLELKLRIDRRAGEHGPLPRRRGGDGGGPEGRPDRLAPRLVPRPRAARAGRTQETLDAFHALVDELPGELAPKHALGIAYEASGALDQAIHYYNAVSRADSAFVSAALRLGALPGEEGGPRRRRRGVPARALLLEPLRPRADGAGPPPRHPPQGRFYTPIDDLVAAAQAVEALEGVMDGLKVSQLKADLFEASARCVAGTAGLPADTKILGVALSEKGLRLRRRGGVPGLRPSGEDRRRALRAGRPGQPGAAAHVGVGAHSPPASLHSTIALVGSDLAQRCSPPTPGGAAAMDVLESRPHPPGYFS